MGIFFRAARTFMILSTFGSCLTFTARGQYAPRSLSPDISVPAILRQNYFNDEEALERNWVTSFIDNRLPSHKRLFCAEAAAGRIRDRVYPAHETWIPYNRASVYPQTLDTADRTFLFNNPPGPTRSGLCWLHSRLQRNFAYLALWRPDLAEPSRPQILAIIDRIAHRRGVTEIPGFRNLGEFSLRFEAELVDAMVRMGVECVVNTNDCLARIDDSYRPSPQEFAGQMMWIYERYIQNPGEIIFVRTRALEFEHHVLRFFGAHSALILKMRPLNASPFSANTGFEVEYIDSSDASHIMRSIYHFGDTSIHGLSDHVWHSHYEYEGDIREMREQIRSYCRP